MVLPSPIDTGGMVKLDVDGLASKLIRPARRRSNSTTSGFYPSS